jgi:hypothetical protein
LASWKKVHSTDESRFLLHVTDGDNRTLFMLSVPLLKLFLSEDAVMVWGCVAYDCKLDLITVRGNLNEQIYRQDIFEASVVPHFDNHPLNTRHVFMDDTPDPTELVL